MKPTASLRRPALGVLVGCATIGAVIGAPGCEEAKRDPPAFTPTSGTTNPTTSGTGTSSGTTSGGGGGGSGGATASGSTSSSGTTSSASSTASGATGTSTGSVCMNMDCVPACNGFQMCIEVTPCDFKCTQGAIGDPCATSMDCVATLQCVNHECI